MGQPDFAFVGGLGQFMKIAALFAARKNHLPTFQSRRRRIRADCSHSFRNENTAIFEVAPAYGPLHSEVIGDSFIVKDGYVYPPEKRGRGIELSEKTKRSSPLYPEAASSTAYRAKG